MIDEELYDIVPILGDGIEDSLSEKRTYGQFATDYDTTAMVV